MSLYSKGHHQPWCELPKDHKGGCQNVTATEYRARIAQLEAHLRRVLEAGAAGRQSMMQLRNLYRLEIEAWDQATSDAEGVLRK